MNRDRYDLPLTTTSDRAAAHYRDGMDCMLSAWHGAEDAFDRAIQEDADFALAHIARARLHQLNMQGSEARAMAAQARQLAVSADARERRHIEIMAAVIEGKPKVAVSGAEAHLEEYPRDALVLSMLLGAFGLYAFSGRADHDAAKLAVCERAATHYGEDWWFLSYLGWSHTEAGNLTTGRALSERAMGLRAANANAAHGLSHAMFEQGDMAAGRQFLSAWLPAHDRKSFLHGHLWWHISLTALDEGDLDTRACDLRTANQAGRPPLSAAEYFHRRRLVAVAAVAGRQIRPGAALARRRRLWRPIFPAGRGAFRRRPPRAIGGGNRRRGAGNTIGAAGSPRRRRQTGAGPRGHRPLPRHARLRRRRQ